MPFDFSVTISPLWLFYLIVLVTVIYTYILYPIYFSPLACIPNAHPLAPLTSLWILWIRYNGKECSTINQAFKINGSVVRVGPAELSINRVDQGVKQIYGGVGFPKSEYYSCTAKFGYVFHLALCL